MHENINWHLIVFVFCATLSSYNFHYILAGAIGKQKLSLALFTARPVATIFFLCGIMGTMLFYFQSNLSFYRVMIALVLTGLYSVPLLPFPQLDFARKAGLLKTVLLAFSWMYVTAYLPMTTDIAQLSTLELLILAKRFLFMLMLCILFDNRDVHVDTINGLHSLATDLSPKLMQALIFTVFILLFTLNFFFGKYGIDSRQVMALQVSSLATLIVYFFSRKQQGYFFYYFIVDGMMILMTVLTTIASI